MRKREREIIFDKYGGKCAYCGCELHKGWHVDEIEPVRRNYEYVRNQANTGVGWVKRMTGSMHPERFNIDNQNPACASCNINKHSMSLEEFRSLISGVIKSLNKASTQYKIAKRYGLITETIKPVIFYFETTQSQ